MNVLLTRFAYCTLLYLNFLYIMGSLMSIFVRRDIEHGEEGNTVKKMAAMTKAVMYFLLDFQYGNEMMAYAYLSLFLLIRLLNQDVEWPETSNQDETFFYWSRFIQLLSINHAMVASFFCLFRIFDKTRFVTVLFMSVFWDMQAFFAIFMISIVQYAQQNIYLEQHLQEEGLIGGSKLTGDAIFVTWEIILVNYDYEYKTRYGKFIYMFYSYMMNIIMLNLLISIVANTFQIVNDNRKGIDYFMKSQNLLFLSQIYNLRDKTFGGFMKSIIGSFFFVPMVASTVFRYLLVKPFILILETLGCKKKHGSEYDASYVIQEGGEAGEV